MNHKRKRHRNARAGCKLCKPWKANGVATESEGGEKFSDHKRRTAPEMEENPFGDAKLGKRVYLRDLPSPEELRHETLTRE